MMGVKKIIRPVSKEFRKSNCCFDHTPADDFVKSQWQNRTKSLLYLIYRWAIAIFFIGTVLNSMLDHEMTGHYFIYLTNWGILMCLSTSILGAVLVTLWHYHPEYADKVTDSESMPRAFKIYWAMHNITLVLSLNITIIYWSVLYNSEVELTPTNVLTHAFNSIFMLLDLLIVAYPIRLLHFFLPVSFGAIFGIFTGIYYICGGLDPKGNHYVYTILDWSKPGKTFGTIIATLLFTTIIHCLVFAVCKLRAYICKRYEKSSMFLPTTSTTKLSKSATPPIVTHPASGISMVLGNYEHDNQAFNGSTEKVCI